MTNAVNHIVGERYSGIVPATTRTIDALYTDISRTNAANQQQQMLLQQTTLLVPQVQVAPGTAPVVTGGPAARNNRFHTIGDSIGHHGNCFCDNAFLANCYSPMDYVNFLTLQHYI